MKVILDDKDIINELDHMPYGQFLNVFLWMLKDCDKNIEEVKYWVKAGWGSRHNDSANAKTIIKDTCTKLAFAMEDIME